MKRFLVTSVGGGSAGKRARGSDDASVDTSCSPPSSNSNPRPRKISNHIDLDVLYYSRFLDDGSIGLDLASLPLSQTSIVMLGKTIKEPRLTGWFGSKPMKYSGSVRQPKPFTSKLNEIRQRIEELQDVQDALAFDTSSGCRGSSQKAADEQRNNDRATASRHSFTDNDHATDSRHSFTGCLANLYLDGSQYMGYHRDDEPENGPSKTNRVIASVTLGESRKFVFKRDRDNAKVEINLEPGSLLLMKGRTQSLWKHSVPKTAKKVGKRLNLTYRVVL